MADSILSFHKFLYTRGKIEVIFLLENEMLALHWAVENSSHAIRIMMLLFCCECGQYYDSKIASVWTFRRIWWCRWRKSYQRGIQNMEEKHTISVRFGYDPCPGMAKLDSTVAPWCHKVGRGQQSRPVSNESFRWSLDTLGMFNFKVIATWGYRFWNLLVHVKQQGSSFNKNMKWMPRSKVQVIQYL